LQISPTHALLPSLIVMNSGAAILDYEIRLHTVGYNLEGMWNYGVSASFVTHMFIQERKQLLCYFKPLLIWVFYHSYLKWTVPHMSLQSSKFNTRSKAKWNNKCHNIFMYKLKVQTLILKCLPQ
jgi:hypothetical protein